MNATHRLFLLALALLLGACAKPLQSDHYVDRTSASWLDANRFVVSYRGSRDIPEQTAVDLTLLRSAEIALQNDFHFFAIVDGEAAASAADSQQRTGAAEYIVHDGKRYHAASPATRNTVVCFERKPRGFAYVALFVKASLRAKYGLDQTSPAI
jgi:hypothetical protein